MDNSNIAERGKATRFPVNRKDHTMKHPDGYLTPKFKKWLAKQIYPSRNQTTGEVEHIKGLDAVAIATIKKALKGDMRATEILLDRIEGKVTQKVETEIKVTKLGDITIENKPLELDIGQEDDITRDIADAREASADTDGVQ